MIGLFDIVGVIILGIILIYYEKKYEDKLDRQLKPLVEEGIIPSVDSSIQEKLSKGKVLSKEEREDPGLKARAEIFETMYVVAQQREAEQKPPIADAIHIYSRYIAKKDKKPAGHSAPVSGGRKAVVTPEEDMSYEELKKASFEDLIWQFRKYN